MDTFLDRLEQQIASRHLLTHPFYLAWTRGELRRDTLAAYAQQYYQHVAAFPTYLSAAHAGCDDQFVRRQLLANLIDEEAGEPNHPALWRQFAESLGVTPNELEKVEIWPETAALIATFRRICRSRNTVLRSPHSMPTRARSRLSRNRKSTGCASITGLPTKTLIAISPFTSKPIANMPRSSARSLRRK